jgi:hypothetical protein
MELGCSSRIWQDFFPGSLAGFWVRIRFFFQNPARKKNPAGQEYKILAEKNSCRAAGEKRSSQIVKDGLTRGEREVFKI